MMRCKRCNASTFQRDDNTGNSFCGGCGTLQEYDNYEAQAGFIRGPEGTNIRVGTTGTGSVLAYKDKKIYEANKLIEEITQRLNLDNKTEAIKTMISKISDEEFGQGEWFSILIGACCYAVVREEGKCVLPIEEIAGEVNCDLHQLGSMIKRVVEHLGLEFQELDLVGLFIKTADNSSKLSDVDREKKERITKQGAFLMNCALKWSLSTGRKPMPLVVAVLAFVIQVNGMKITLEDLAKDARVPLTTCKARYKELSERLVKVAEEVSLPWAKNVNVKNVVKHSGTLIGIMESRSMRKRKQRTGDELVRPNGFCLDDLVNDCLSKSELMGSSEDLWKGKSELSQKLPLRKVLEKDVGLDILPPSYINGCVAVERRKEKIKEAKLRINAIRHPSDVDNNNKGGELSLELEHGNKRRKKVAEIDREDMIIQTLLLHDVKEEEIQKGYYKSLLDLHVFNSRKV